MKTVYSMFIAGSILLLVSCQKPSTALTEDQKKQIADSAIQVIKQVLDLSNHLDFTSVLNYYSSDADARYIENGYLYPSLDVLKTAYTELVPSLDYIKNTADTYHTLVLSNDAVAVTVPIHFKIKAKELAEYNGQYVWSAIVQKRNGKWTIVQTHESWLNYAEAIAALTPKTQEYWGKRK
jgi:hypothetical protein